MRLAIETGRLILRLPVPADAPAVARGVGVWDVASMLAIVPFPYVPEMAENWLRAQAENRRTGKSISFAVALREAPGDLLGIVSLNERCAGQAELGYWLAMTHWGKGYMSEAAHAAVAFGFDVWGLGTVNSGYFEENARSGRVLAKLGFIEEGRSPRACAARNNSEVPHVGMTLRAGDWWRGADAASSL